MAQVQLEYEQYNVWPIIRIKYCIAPQMFKKNKMRNNHEYKFVYIQLDNRE